VHPYYFLSYCHEPYDRYVERFHDDLAAEVRIRLAGSVEAPPEPVGFRDVSAMPVGSYWKRRLSDALGCCRSFVPLYSPEYFSSDFCGREWAVFERRMRLYEADQSVRPELVVPVLWKTVADLPAAAAEIQYLDDDFPEPYRAHGMEYLVRLWPDSVEYRTAVRVLADRIVRACRLHLLPPYVEFDLDRETGSFGAGGVPAQRLRRRGHVTFMVAAPVRDRLPSGRRNAEAYGGDPLDWSPYSVGAEPQDGDGRRGDGEPHGGGEPCGGAEPLATWAQQQVGGRRYTSDVEVVDAALPERVAAARGRNRIAVLLVDPWATLMPQYAAPLRGYDARNEPASGVLLPLHPPDTETMSQLGTLEPAVGRTFPRGFASGARHIGYGVTAERFVGRLMALVAEAQNALVRLADPRPDLAAAVPGPTLGGPAPAGPAPAGPAPAGPARGAQALDGAAPGGPVPGPRERVADRAGPPPSPAPPAAVNGQTGPPASGSGPDAPPAPGPREEAER